jgi:hypothetical protein
MAAACAVVLAPGEPEYLDTQAEIASRTAGSEPLPVQCVPLQCPAAAEPGKE